MSDLLVARLEKFSMPEPNSGCQLWLGYVSAGGYGRVTADGTTQFAHRVAWQVRRGAIPAGMFVCHKCDVPSCINPDHLFLGTPKENSLDMRAKGRGLGSALPKLAAADVLAIFRSADTHAELAEKYAISIGAVADIRRGRSWAVVTGATLMPAWEKRPADGRMRN